MRSAPPHEHYGRVATAGAPAPSRPFRSAWRPMGHRHRREPASQWTERTQGWFVDAAGQIGLDEWRNIQKGGPWPFADGRSYQWASEFTGRGLRDRQFDESSQWWLWDSGQRAVLGARLERSTTTVTLLPEAANIPELGLAGLAAYSSCVGGTRRAGATATDWPTAPRRSRVSEQRSPPPRAARRARVGGLSALARLLGIHVALVKTRRAHRFSRGSFSFALK